jgi:hypothetical protein
MRRNSLIVLFILMCAPPAIAEAPPPEITPPPAANPACDLEAMRCGADIFLKNSTSPMPPEVAPTTLTIAPSPQKAAEVTAKPERPKSTFWQDLFWFIVGRSVR